MACALTYAAVNNNWLLSIHSKIGINLFQLSCRLEGAVCIDGGFPRDIDSTWDMSGANCKLLESCRSKDLSAELIRRTDINQSRLLLLLCDL